jgi:hypothetical protein
MTSTLRRRGSVAALGALLLLVCVPAVWANMGTPLMWTTGLHLLFGNALIGIGEGALIAALFRAGRPRYILICVAANYFSAWSGAFSLDSTWVRGTVMPWILGETPLYNVPRLLVLFTAASFVMSVILEWPFIGLALGQRPRRWRQAMLASLVAQTASYAVLVPLYIASSDVSLYKAVQIDRSLAFARGVPAWVYYIGPEGGDVWRVRLGGSERSKVRDIPRVGLQAKLLARRSAASAPWDLWVRWDTHSKENPLEAVVLTAFAAGQVSEFAGENEDDDEHLGGNVDADLRSTGARDWTVEGSAWSDGIWAKGGPGPASNVRLGSLETPWLMWQVNKPVVLPGDLVVFSLLAHGSPDQIVVVGLRERRIGLLARGSGFLVALDATPPGR